MKSTLLLTTLLLSGSLNLAHGQENVPEDFCKQLKTLVKSANNDFSNNKGETSEPDLFGSVYYQTKLPLSGSNSSRVEDWYFPQAIYNYYDGKDQVTAINLISTLSSWVQSCQLGWEDDIEEIEPSKWTTTKGTTIGFIEAEKGKTGRAVVITSSKYYGGYRVFLIVNQYENE